MRLSGLRLLPRAAVANDRDLGCLKQCSLLRCRSGAQRSSTGLTGLARAVSRAGSSWRSEAEAVLLLLLAPEAPGSLLVASSACFCHHGSCPDADPLPSLVRGPCIITGPPRCSRTISPRRGSPRPHLQKSPLSCRATVTGFRGYIRWKSWGPSLCLPQVLFFI